MIVYERQQKILEFLKENNTSTVKQLSKIVWSSESSVRRDIKYLEQKGLVCSIYGGVTLTEYKNNVLPLGIRDNNNVTVKEEIAKKAAKYIFDGATIILDGSTTVRRIIKYLNPYKNITIITNNQSVFENPIPQNAKIYCTGGLYDAKSNIFYGHTAESYISKINADILFFSSQAISSTGEISDVSEYETSLRKVMLTRAKQKIFLCDSTKLNQTKTFLLCTKDDVDNIICDKPLPF